MKILLINPKHKKAYGDILPLGLCSISAMLKHKGFNNVKGIDLFLDNEKDFIDDFKTADYVGIHVTSKLYKSSVSLSKRIKKYNKNVKIVWGGPHPTLYPAECLDNEEIDYVIRGEGEIPFTELMSGVDHNHIEGLCYNIWSGKVIKDSFFVKELDILPFPDRDLFDMNRYKPYKFYPAFVPIMASRSCPYNCTNCQPGLRLACGPFRIRTPRNVVEEFKYLENKYKVKKIWFNDNDVTVNNKWLKEFCNLLIKEKIKIQWGGNGRGNTLNRENMSLMKKAGCIIMQYGIEFGNQRVLDECLNKRTNLAKSIEVIKIANEIKLRINAYYMFGIPGSTKQEEFESIDLASKLTLNSISFQCFQPEPMINILDIATARNWLMEYDFSDLDEDKCFFNTDNWDKDFVEKELVEYIRKKFSKDWIHDYRLVYRNIKVDVRQDPIIFFGRQILSFFKDYKITHFINIYKGLIALIR